MKHLRLIAVFLLTAMLLPLSASVCGSAYGSGDGTLIITHINTANSTEGSAIILSGTQAQKVGEKGSFAWWTVLIFDWDAAQGCFVLTDRNINANDVDKSDMKIPANGFAYCICVGNDYSGSGGINYITDRIKNSSDYAKTLEIGTKAYLYGTSLSAGVISTNGKNWYADDFASDSYIRIGAPENGKTAYDPIKNANDLPQIRIETNYVNSSHYASGDCILFDASYGSYVEHNYGYEWWRCLVFDWDAEQGCHTVTAIDTAAGTGNRKCPVIPKNGFVLLDCGSASQTAFTSAAIGMKAYLYKQGSQYLVCLNVPDETQTPVIPENASALKPAPVLNGLSATVSAKCKPDGFAVEWSPVEGAASYTVAVYSSTPTALGVMLVPPHTVTETNYSIPSGIMEVGNAYTVAVSADNSACAFGKLYCVSAEAFSSNLSDKTVLAFGDSLTARSGWVSMLGGYLGTEVINAGVGGDTTANAIARFEKDVLAKDPDIALVCFGMNDQAQKLDAGKPNISLDTYVANMEKLITGLQEIGTDVILIAPHDAYAADGYYTPGSYGLDYAYGNMKDFCDAVRALALKYNCGLIDIYAETQDADMGAFLNAGDGIHQSPEGHSLWAEYVSAYLLARYDGKNTAAVTVECKDESNAVIGSYTLTTAIGSALYLPAMEIEGRDFLGEVQYIRVKGDTTVTYAYSGTTEREESTGTESGEDTETVSASSLDASASDTDGNTSMLWIVLLAVAVLTCGVAVAIILLKKK